MAVVLRSLSDFKRFLRKPSATIQIVRNSFIERQAPLAREAYRRKGLFEPRTVRALSKKAAVFDVRGHDATVWLYWDTGVRKWRFSGDTVAVPLQAAVGAPDEVVYRCSLPSEAARSAAIATTNAEARPARSRARRVRPAANAVLKPADA